MNISVYYVLFIFVHAMFVTIIWMYVYDTKNDLSVIVGKNKYVLNHNAHIHKGPYCNT